MTIPTNTGLVMEFGDQTHSLLECSVPAKLDILPRKLVRGEQQLILYRG